MEISQRIARSKPLATTAMHGRVDAMKARGEDVIDFSIAISHFQAPEAVLEATRAGLRQPSLAYTAVVGDAAIRTTFPFAALRHTPGGSTMRPWSTRSDAPEAASSGM